MHEVHPEKGREASALSMSYAVAPLGFHALMLGPKCLSFFNEAGRSVDVVWGKPAGVFSVSQRGKYTEVQARKQADAVPTIFRFADNGMLASVQHGKVSRAPDQEQDALFPNVKQPLKAFWGRVAPEKIGAEYWRGTDRLRLGYSNPNAAGALFAELALFALASLLFVPFLWARLISGGTLIAMLWLLFLTGSRSSFLGFCLGALILACSSAARHFSLKKLLMMAGAIAVVAGLLACGVFGDRFGKNLLERNESNMLRIRCWSAAPAMMAAAPGGWGEKCGHAYCDWFQPAAEYHPQHWLFNSHLTWMVEHGWVFRFAYSTGWLLLLVLIGAAAFRSRMAGTVLALWLSFGVAMWFSTIGQNWTLWLAPVLSLLAVAASMVARCPEKMAYRTGVALALSVLAGAGVCLTLWLSGSHSLAKMEFQPHHANGVTTIGGVQPKVCILNDNLVTSLGLVGTFGREVRDFLRRNPGFGSLAIAKQVENIPSDVSTVVVSGRRSPSFMRLRIKKRAFPHVKRMVFLSPTFKPNDMLTKAIRCDDVQFISGEIMRSLYLEKGETPPKWVKFVQGAGLYVPGWMDMAFGKEK